MDAPSILDSRKFKALLLGLGMQFLPVVMTFTFVLLHAATKDDFIGLVKWALPSIAVMIGTYMASQAWEDASAKKVGPINAGGDVTVRQQNVAAPAVAAPVVIPATP